MVKIKKDDDEAVTKGWLRDTLSDALKRTTTEIVEIMHEAIDKAVRKGTDELAFLINKSFVGVESRMAIVESSMSKVEFSVAKLESSVSKLEFSTAKQEDLLALIKKVDRNDAATRASIAGLDLRVHKLGKKATL
jgi:hypothetical protein